MVIFTPIEEIKAKGKVKKVFERIKKERKIKAIPNFWKTIANDPDTLERTWDSLKDIMKKGALDPLFRRPRCFFGYPISREVYTNSLE